MPMIENFQDFGIRSNAVAHSDPFNIDSLRRLSHTSSVSNSPPTMDRITCQDVSHHTYSGTNVNYPQSSLGQQGYLQQSTCTNTPLKAPEYAAQGLHKQSPPQDCVQSVVCSTEDIPTQDCPNILVSNNPPVTAHNQVFIKTEPGVTGQGSVACCGSRYRNSSSELIPPKLELEWNRRSELDLYIKEEMCDWDDMPTCKENLEYTLGFDGCLHESLPELLPLLQANPLN
jgi:hypothetical protein